MLVCSAGVLLPASVHFKADDASSCNQLTSDDVVLLLLPADDELSNTNSNQQLLNIILTIDYYLHWEATVFSLLPCVEYCHNIAAIPCFSYSSNVLYDLSW